MKVLFICKGNMTRSQIAEEFYNRLATDGSKASSAGTVPGTIAEEPESWQLNQVPYLGNVLAVMKEEGFDLSLKKTIRVTPEMVATADVVINMAEKETMPDFLLQSPKVLYWEIPNPTKTLESAKETKDKIKELVRKLINSQVR
jgi:protein-tyrosine-phosphatase